MLFLPPPAPPCPASPGIASRTVGLEPSAACPCAGGSAGSAGSAEFGRLLLESLFFLSSPPGEGWSCSESGLVWDDYIWFLFLFFWITILPIPSCLPPLNMYINYTETAINMYIVFGSNSMRRWGTI